MSTRREFFTRSAAAAAVPLFTPKGLDLLERTLEPYALASATDEAFWTQIRGVFPKHPYINLENGYSSPQPNATYAAFRDHTGSINNGLSFYMRRKKADDYARIKKELAQVAGITPEELAITRNTTEALGTIIHGIDLGPGDEVIFCNQDYGSMVAQFRMQAQRRLIRCIEVALPLDPSSDDEIVNLYARAMTSRTKLLLLSHMVNITGHILPVRKIAEVAHARGVQVVIDGAHTFAHLDFTIPQLGGDYFGTSLHKWLCTPLGAGFLYVKRDKIRDAWPLFGETAYAEDDIRKFERIGTVPSWTVLAISDAIRFHNMVGAQRKQERLRYLQSYWSDRAREIPNVYLNTPRGDRACGIANVGIKDRKPAELATTLFDKYKVYTVAIDTPAVKGLRITPHLYTTTAELDTFVKALREMAKS